MSGKDVLIVDDEADVRELFAGVLNDSGYSVDVARTVTEAKKLLSESRYGVVIADWRLPDGDGGVVANLAAGMGSCAFLMSGYLAHMPSVNVDPRHTLMKPVRPPELLAIIRAAIGERPLQAAAKTKRDWQNHD